MAKKSTAVAKADNPYSVVAEMRLIHDDDPLPVEQVSYGGHRGKYGYDNGTRNYAFVAKRHANRVRPSLREPGVLDRICEELALGRGLWEITKDENNFPSKKEIYLTMARDPGGEVATRIAQARELGQEAILDLIRDLNDKITEENYQSTVAQIKNLQWQMAKLNPKKYGKDAEEGATNIDNRKQTIINITANEYQKVTSRLIEDV